MKKNAVNGKNFQFSKEEKKAIENTEQILKEWQKIVDIEDDMEREIEMHCYSEEMPFFEMKTLLKLVKKQEQEIKKGKKFKKDIVNSIMFWDEEDLPENDRVIECLDTIMSEVSRLEDIEDRKIQVAVNFIEEKRDKYWKDKIQGEIKELEELRRYLTIKKHLITANGMIEISVCIDVLKRLLEGG